MAEQGTTGAQMKRRGILAAAGVAVAGIVAKQAVQPVGAFANVLLGAANNAAATSTVVENTAAGSESGAALVGWRQVGAVTVVTGGDAGVLGHSEFVDADGVL